MEEEKKPNNIQNYLKRFKSFIPPTRRIKDVFLVQLENVYNIIVLEQQVRVVKNQIYIRTTPIIKAEILKRKKEIILHIEKELDIVGVSIN